MGSIDEVKSILEKLERELAKFPVTGENRMMAIESSFYLVDESIEMLKTRVKGFEFKDEKEEIQFFKRLMVELFSKSHFYSELFHIESEKPVDSPREIPVYYRGKMEEVKKYFQRNVGLNNYLLMGKTHLDRVYFLRSSESPILYPDLVHHTLDSSFCTVYTIYFGRLQAMARLMDYLANEVSAFSQMDVDDVAKREDEAAGLYWTGTKVELVELIYALKATAVVNSGTVSVANLAAVLGRAFGRQLRGYYKTFEEIRSRKKSRTFFLDRCKSKLDSYIEEYEGKE
jgi:hypothetical protein